MKLPVFGWGFHILEFISVERKWEVDEPAMREMLSTFKDSRDPLWLALFPEGTDFRYFNLLCILYAGIFTHNIKLNFYQRYLATKIRYLT
jgi:1-acyl-sn-glycerol-3-phosphate acyltransferase